MISRFGFGKNAVCHLGLAIVLERAVKTVDEFTAPDCHQEVFEGWVSRLIAAFDGLHIPGEGCLGILRACEAECLVKGLILRLRQFRQAIEEVQPFMGGLIRRW